MNAGDLFEHNLTKEKWVCAKVDEGDLLFNMTPGKTLQSIWKDRRFHNKDIWQEYTSLNQKIDLWKDFYSQPHWPYNKSNNGMLFEANHRIVVEFVPSFYKEYPSMQYEFGEQLKFIVSEIHDESGLNMPYISLKVNSYCHVWGKWSPKNLVILDKKKL